jgi:transposase-like protein
MNRKPRVDRSPEEKWQIIQEGLKSGNISETCRHHGIAANLFYRSKDEAEQSAARTANAVTGFEAILRDQCGPQPEHSKNPKSRHSCSDVLEGVAARNAA